MSIYCTDVECSPIIRRPPYTPTFKEARAVNLYVCRLSHDESRFSIEYIGNGADTLTHAIGGIMGNAAVQIGSIKSDVKTVDVFFVLP